MSKEHRVVRVVVNCADRKTRTPLESLRLGNYEGALEGKARKWIRRIDSPPPGSDRTAANDLYKGDHWLQVRKIAETANKAGYEAQMWVVSAGYGLVPVTALLEPYSATFSPGSADSVSLGASNMTPREANRSWWAQLAERPQPYGDTPRSLAQLARQDPSSPMLVALSRAYVQAICDDLLEAAAAMGNKADLLLVSTGTPPKGLEGTQLPCDASLLNILKGTRTSLNARAAGLIVENASKHGFDAHEVKKMLERKLRKAGKIPRYDRLKQTDEEILGWIHERLTTGPFSHSPLLTELRNKGIACEQKRFKGLHEQAVTERSK